MAATVTATLPGGDQSSGQPYLLTVITNVSIVVDDGGGNSNTASKVSNNLSSAISMTEGRTRSTTSLVYPAQSTSATVESDERSQWGPITANGTSTTTCPKGSGSRTAGYAGIVTATGGWYETIGPAANTSSWQWPSMSSTDALGSPQQTTITTTPGTLSASRSGMINPFTSSATLLVVRWLTASTCGTGVERAGYWRSRLSFGFLSIRHGLAGGAERADKFSSSLFLYSYVPRF